MMSIPTATLTPCGTCRGAGSPAIPAGPNSQSGMGTPGWRTRGVKMRGWLSSSIPPLPRATARVPTPHNPTPAPTMTTVVAPLRSHCRGGGGWVDGWGPLRSPSYPKTVRSRHFSHNHHLFPVPLADELLRRGAVSGWQDGGGGGGAASHAAIDEAQAVHLRRLIDVSTIDHHRAAHGGADLQHIQRLELVPLGHDYQGVRALRRFIGIRAKLHLLHTHAFA